MLLSTSYTIAQIYDLDTGLTPRQLEHLGQGVLDRQREQYAQSLRVWGMVGPLLATAAGAGFGAGSEGLSATMKQLFAAAAQLEQPPEPVADPGPAAPTVDLGAHPFIIANFGKPIR